MTAEVTSLAKAAAISGARPPSVSVHHLHYDSEGTERRQRRYFREKSREPRTSKAKSIAAGAALGTGIGAGVGRSMGSAVEVLHPKLPINRHNAAVLGGTLAGLGGAAIGAAAANRDRKEMDRAQRFEASTEAQKRQYLKKHLADRVAAKDRMRHLALLKGKLF